jgi:hypothetical protein
MTGDGEIKWMSGSRKNSNEKSVLKTEFRVVKKGGL